MKILFVAPRYHTNQVHIVHTLQEYGHEVHFHVNLHGVTEDHNLLLPVIFPESKISALIRSWFGDGDVNKKRYFPKPINYWRKFKKLAPDIVVIRIYGFVFSYMAAFYGVLCGSRVVFYAQLDTEKIKQLYNASSLKSLLRKAIFNFLISMFNAAWMTPLHSTSNKPKELPSCRFYVPFAVAINEQQKKCHERLKILVIGKYNKRKNHLLMVRAVLELSKRYKFGVSFIGEASSDLHQTQKHLVVNEIERLGLEKVIEIRDSVDFSEMNALYEEHDIFVLPATNEPASISVLEALGQGLPTICSDTCGTKTYIQSGVNGFVFESDNLQSLVEKIEKFLVNPQLCEEMSKNATDFAKENISSKAYYHHFMRMLNKHFGIQIDNIEDMLSHKKDVF
jgi:glycosyltransferase involved in cell wall biosynthesis